MLKFYLNAIQGTRPVIIKAKRPAVEDKDKQSVTHHCIQNG